MIGKQITEQCWTYEQLQQMDQLNVRCATCKLLYGSKDDVIESHIKETGHNSFFKYDEEKENKQKRQVSINQESEIALQNKLAELKIQADKIHQNLFLGLKVSLSAILQMRISDNPLPIAVFFAGTDNDSVLTCIQKIPQAYHVDSFTPKSFVSHSARTSGRNLKSIDLLPQMRNKAMITKKVETIFSGSKPTVSENIGIIDTVMAGNGYTSYSAVFGKRGYDEPLNFAWLGTINTVDSRYWASIGRMRHKPYLFQLGTKQNSGKADFDNMLGMFNKNTSLPENPISAVVMDFWNTLWKHFSNEKILEWEYESDDKEICKYIIKLSYLLSRLGAFIPTSNTGASDSGGTSYNFEEPIMTDPQLMYKNLYNLARGHAIIRCRNYVTQEDLEPIIHIVLSSLPPDRLSLLDTLLHFGEIVSTDQMEDHLQVSKATALKEMKKLNVLDIVDSDAVDGVSKPMLSIRLKKEYHWIFDNPFRNYYDTKFHTHTS